MAQGTLLNGMWQPGWEGSFGENGYVDTHTHTSRSVMSDSLRPHGL